MYNHIALLQNFIHPEEPSIFFSYITIALTCLRIPTLRGIALIFLYSLIMLPSLTIPTSGEPIRSEQHQTCWNLTQNSYIKGNDLHIFVYYNHIILPQNSYIGGAFWFSFSLYNHLYPTPAFLLTFGLSF